MRKAIGYIVLSGVLMALLVGCAGKKKDATPAQTVSPQEMQKNMQKGMEMMQKNKPATVK
jgi:hypothetical protein